MQNLGYRAVNSTVDLYFSTNAATGAAVTFTGDIASDNFRIFKDGSITQRSSMAGVTLTKDFDGITGTHMLAIDLSDNTDAGFYAAGSNYAVMARAITVDALTVSVMLGQFDIGVPPVNVTQLLGTAWLTPGTAGTPDVNAKLLGGTAQTGRDIGASVLLAAGQITFKKNVARANFAFPMRDTAGALTTGLAVTAVIRKDAGAAFAALAGAVTEIGATGWYTVDFAQAETNADTIAFSASAAGAVPTCITIITQA